MKYYDSWLACNLYAVTTMGPMLLGHLPVWYVHSY